jgi:hypothetical protein
MPMFELALLMAAAGVAAFPCWPYSADWGYWPSATAGVLLVFVAAAATSGMPGGLDSRANKMAAKANATIDTVSAPAPGTRADANVPGRDVEISDLPVRQTQ